MAQTEFSGPIISSGAPQFAIPLPMYPTALAAASGTIIPYWRAVLPNHPTTLHDIGVTFTRGGTTPPQGGTMSFKAWSGTTAKGLFSGSVAGATAEAVTLTKTGGATFPAGAHLQLSVNTVGGTLPGRGARPTLYLGFRRA
jgi:hypothetical protein